MYKDIGEYGIIGNLRTVALVAVDGSVDWFCYPHLDSPSVFAAILDADKGGSFAVGPDVPSDKLHCSQRYEEKTNILVSRMETEAGVLRVTDFMPVTKDQSNDSDSEEAEGTRIFRRVTVEKGQVSVRVRFAPAYDYAREKTSFSKLDGGAVAVGGDMELALTATRPLEIQDDAVVGTWSMNEGEEAWLRLGASTPDGRCSREDKACVTADSGLQALEYTTEYWREWMERSETECSYRFGEYTQMIERSALVLKLLQYRPTGVLAAAPTTSLPEEIGGTRNWDYRFTWIRDASFTLQAFYELGHIAEAEKYLDWLRSVLDRTGKSELQIMYGLREDSQLEEQELTHLDGHKDSRPVRIGNGAAGQVQMDIYGELMDVVSRLISHAGSISEEHWDVLRGICEYVHAHWQDPDAGIWEVRCEPQHFVFSKVMCWVALQRGVDMAEQHGFDCDVERWEEAMSAIRQEVLEQGYDAQRSTFVQHYDTTELDASCLLIPIMGFLPFDDPRVIGTVETIQQELQDGGLIRRYTSDDGIEGGEGVFLICNCWLAQCLAEMGRLEEAQALLKRIEETANPLGLFAEEYDPKKGMLLGNYPQAFTHLGYVLAVMRVLEHRQK